MSELSYLRVTLYNGTCCDVETMEMPRLVEAIRKQSASDVDTILELQTVDDTIFVVRASVISDLFLFTPRSRERNREIARELKEEHKADSWKE